MRNQDAWRPTKFVISRSGLRASADPREVALGSRLTVDLQARSYHLALIEHCRGTLLDLGCGKAPLYIVYKDLATSVTCVDWVNSYHDTGHADICCDISGGLPLADEQFETVLATDVLEHMPDPKAVWLEIARVLRPEGKVIVGVPFLYWVHEAPYDFFRYTRYKLAEFCRDTGLEVLILEPYGGAVEVVLDVLAKHAAVCPILSRIFYRISRFLVYSKPGRTLSERSSEHFPLGYLLVARKPGII